MKRSYCFWCIFLFVFSANCQMTTYRTPLSDELIILLETIYCTDKPDLFPCNSAEGKVCMKTKCVSACLVGRLAPCTCPADSHCNLCCGNSTNPCKNSINYNIFENSGVQWTRQNSLDSCGQVTRPSSNPVCPTNQNGKICDLVLKSSVPVEEPRVCFNGQCVPIMCNSFFAAGQVGKTIVPCDCHDGYKNYPVCCRDLNNATCFPAQTWLRAPQGRGYIDAIGVVKQPTTLPTMVVINPPDSQTGSGNTNTQSIDDVDCSFTDSEKKRCGGMNNWCSNGQCQHVCGRPGRECYCDVDSGTECHICCLNEQDVCLSINQNQSHPEFIRHYGHPCDYTRGRCNLNGTCEMLSQRALSTSFCHQKTNDGKLCDPETHFVCKNLDCVHPCGTSSNECVCSVDSGHECHQCCKDSTGNCEHVTSTTSPFIPRYENVQCDSGYGTCNDQGVCEIHPNYCSVSPSHNHKKCGDQNKCVEQKCLHVCSNPADVCFCLPGSLEECHVCCLDDKRECRSANVNITDLANRFVKIAGTYCNFSLGVCNNYGNCETVHNNPLALKMCQKAENDGRMCYEKEGYVCDNHTCTHACSEPEDFCVCPPTTDEECHLCCRNETTGECDSIVHQSEPKRRFRSAGTPCQIGEGTCGYNGVCHLLPTMCSNAANENKKCGEQSLCLHGKCEPICGDNDTCVCTTESGDENNQCKICCLVNNICEAAVIPNVQPHLLARPVGTTCKKGSSQGLCNYNGTCAVYRGLMDTKPKGCTACRFTTYLTEVPLLLFVYFVFTRKVY